MTHNKLRFALIACCMLLVAGGCKKNKDSYTELPANNYFLEGTFNGGSFSITDCAAYSSSYSSTAGVPSYYYISSGSYDTGVQGDSIDGANLAIYHTFVTSNYPAGIDSASLDSIYAPSSSLRYYNPQNATGTVCITVATGDGTQWSTANGNASQPGSTFTIATRSYIDQYSRVTITGTFTCTLYDNAGHSRRITGGSYEAYEVLQ